MKWIYPTMIVLVSLLICGCTIPFIGGSKGTLVMKITDARPPWFSLESIEITISEIEVHKAGVLEQTDIEDEVIVENETELDIAEETGEWIMFSEEPQTFDLLQLEGITDILGIRTLDEGKYTQIRLKVDSVIVTADGNAYDATVPSGKIRLIHPFEIRENQTTTLVLDFEADKIVVKTGAEGYLIKPAAIKVYEE